MLVARDWGKDFSGLVIPAETLCKVIGPHLAEETDNKKAKSIATDHATDRQQLMGQRLSPEYKCRFGSSVGQILLSLRGSTVTMLNSTSKLASAAAWEPTWHLLP